MDEPQDAPQKSKWGFGPVVAIIILVAVFAVGGVYLVIHEQARLNTPPIQETINV